MDIEELRRQIEKEINEQNNRARPEFEGYSSQEMSEILYYPFGPKSPLQFQKLAPEDYLKIPLLQVIKHLLGIIEEAGELKLTQKGFLPTKIVAELYNLGHLPQYHIEHGARKLYKETDAMGINLSRILIELTGLVKKRHSKLSLTQKSKKIIADNHKLLIAILQTFTTQYNWGYYDGYNNEKIGPLGFGLSLIILSKYGHIERPSAFYAQKYFAAFPQLLEELEPSYGTHEAYGIDCYIIRTFERFLHIFGLVNVPQFGKVKMDYYKIAKTPLFDKFIKCLPPGDI